MDLGAAPRCVHGLPRATCVFCGRSYWPVMLVWGGTLVALWFALGPGHPVYALIVTAWTWVLGPGVAGPVMRRLPRHWFRVPAGELVSLEQSVRGAASAHGTCFAIHALLSVAALFTGHPSGALWMLLPGVVLHLYPTLLQRAIMLRLQPLLDK